MNNKYAVNRIFLRKLYRRWLILELLYKSMKFSVYTLLYWGPSWTWSYGSWIYNYLLNPAQVRCSVLDSTLCDKVCQWLAIGRWFSPYTKVSSTSKADHHNITEILLKVAWNTIALFNSLLYQMIQLKMIVFFI